MMSLFDIILSLIHKPIWILGNLVKGGNTMYQSDLRTVIMNIIEYIT